MILSCKLQITKVIMLTFRFKIKHRANEYEDFNSMKDALESYCNKLKHIIKSLDEIL